MTEETEQLQPGVGVGVGSRIGVRVFEKNTTRVSPVALAVP